MEKTNLLINGSGPAGYTAAMGVYNSAIDYGLFLGPLLGGALALVSPAAPFGLALPLGLTALVLTLGAADTKKWLPGAEA